MKEEIVILHGNNKEMQFVLIAELEYDGYNYQILKPKKKYDDLDPDMCLVFRLENTPSGIEYFMEENDEIIDEIEKIYNSEN